MANMGTLLQLCFMFGPGVGDSLAELDRRALTLPLPLPYPYPYFYP